MSSFTPLVVTIRIGKSFVASLERMALVSSKPVITGIFQSVITKLIELSAVSFSSATLPSSASTYSLYPKDFRVFTTILLIVLESSTIKNFLFIIFPVKCC